MQMFIFSERKRSSVWIHFVSSQSDLISDYLQDWVSYCVLVCYCVYIIVVNLSPPHLLTHPHPQPPSALSSENHLWAVMDSHEFTHFMANVSGTAVAAGFSVTHTHTCTHRHHKYSCWCLCLVRSCSEVGTHLFKNWSLWVCVCRTHCITLCTNLSDSAHVCVCRGVGGDLYRHCPLNIRAARLSVLHVCVPASLLLCVRMCEWMLFIPPGPDAPAKSITSGAAQRC